MLCQLNFAYFNLKRTDEKRNKSPVTSMVLEHYLFIGKPAKMHLHRFTKVNLQTQTSRTSKKQPPERQTGTRRQKQPENRQRKTKTVIMR